MSAFVKILLSVSVSASWAAAFLIHQLFQGDALTTQLFIQLFLFFLLWLTPFAILVLFFVSDEFLLAAFVLGAAGFIVFSPTLYTLAGMIVLALGFFYWRKRARFFSSGAQKFSSLAILQGIGIFFTTLSLFTAIFYFNSPLGSLAAFEPKIPEKLFDIIYDPLSQTILSQLGPEAGERLKGEARAQVKQELYTTLTITLKHLAAQYQGYIPLAFAAGIFFALKTFFLPFQYVFLGIVFLLIKFFLSFGLLKKEIVQVEKETLSF